MFLLPLRNGALSQRGSSNGPQNPTPVNEGDIAPNDERETAFVSAQQMQSRRQDMVRFCIIVVLLLFLFDGDGSAGSSKPPSTSSWYRNHVELSDNNLSVLQSAMGDSSVSFDSINVTGMFRGSWRPFTPQSVLPPGVSDLSPAIHLNRSEIIE